MGENKINVSLPEYPTNLVKDAKIMLLTRTSIYGKPKKHGSIGHSSAALHFIPFGVIYGLF